MKSLNKFTAILAACTAIGPFGMICFAKSIEPSNAALKFSFCSRTSFTRPIAAA